MAIRAVLQMRRGFRTIKLVLMTRITVISSGSGDQTAVIRCRGMDYIPRRAVTRRTDSTATGASRSVGNERQIRGAGMTGRTGGMLHGVTRIDE